MAYALELRTETLKTRQMLEANEMKVLREIVGKTKIDGKEANKSVDT